MEYLFNDFLESFWKKKSGIYAIVNIKNQKIYIGSSKDIGFRLRKHKETLIRQSHRNRYLQNSFNFHGKNSFVFRILEECEADHLIECEQKWMDFYKSYDDTFGYNIIPRADRQSFSDEHRKNLSLSHMGYRHTEESKQKIKESSTGRIIFITRKPVLQIDFNGNIVKEYPSIFLAAGNVQSKAVAISEACAAKKSITSQGYFWFYKKDFTKEKFLDLKLRKNSQRVRSAKKCYQKIKKLRIDGNLIEEYESLKQASEQNNIDNTAISKCCSGKLKTAGGYIWRKSENTL